MRLTRLLALSIVSLLLGACASSVLPDYGDSGRSDVRTDTALTDRVDAHPTCADFESFCSGRCVDTRVDALHCGGCDRACPSGLGCSGSVCVRPCAMGQISCAGVCVDPRADIANCGGCGRTCEPGARCINGSCPVRCPPDQALCRDRCADLRSDAQNCGGCNRVCPSVVGGIARCTMGMCTQACVMGRIACASQCIDPNSDAVNCGGCGRACAPGARCVGGNCRTLATVTRYDISPGVATFTDVCALPGAIHMLAGVDDVVGMPVPLPFAFPFFGTPFDVVRPTSNGYLLFGATPDTRDNSYYPNTPLPSFDRPHGAAFAYNSDLWQRSGAGVCVATVGTAPRRRFLVETQDASLCCGDTSAQHYTFEIALNEVDGTLDYVYGNIDQGSPTAARAVEVGLQNPDATLASSFAFSLMEPPPGIVSGTSLHLTPLP